MRGFETFPNEREMRREIINPMLRSVITALVCFVGFSDFCHCASNDTASPSLISTSTPQYPVSEECTSAAAERYRRLDGRCSNLQHAGWGASGSPLKRLLPPQYYNESLPRRLSSDGLSPLPSPRQVSLALASALPARRTSDASGMVPAWGQFISHDMSNTPFNMTALGDCCNNSQSQNLSFHSGGPCIPIERVPGDDLMECIPLTRSLPHVATNGTVTVPRTQFNDMTSFLDASAVYGGTEKALASLRGLHGQMATKDGCRLPRAPHGDCFVEHRGDYCQAAGDFRVDVYIGLSLTHTIFVREHNRLVTSLSALNPHWSDDIVFQEARRIVAAEIQHITYAHLLPIWLGPSAVRAYDLDPGHFRYDPDLDPTVANVFATAAFRFGHSQIRQEVKIGNTKLPIEETLKRPHLVQTALTSVVLGLTTAPSDPVDPHLAPGLRNHLFQSGRAARDGMDLVAINLQRGRDHGLPPFNAWRRHCGLPPLEDFRSPELFPNDLATVYRHFDDLDVFVGLLLERHQSDGELGPTLTCLLAQQFRKVKMGDRFFYENPDGPQTFTPAQLQEIRKITWSRILCDNISDLRNIQRQVFLKKNATSNPRVPCGSIPGIDLKQWEDRITQQP